MSCSLNRPSINHLTRFLPVPCVYAWYHLSWWNAVNVTSWIAKNASTNGPKNLTRVRTAVQFLFLVTHQTGLWSICWMISFSNVFPARKTSSTLDRHLIRWYARQELLIARLHCAEQLDLKILKTTGPMNVVKSIWPAVNAMLFCKEMAFHITTVWRAF